VVIVHDYLTQLGGAERVALAMLRTFPGARLVTSVYNAETTFPEFADFEIETSRLQRYAALRRDPRQALPLLASAFDSMHIDDAEVVISSSSGWAHGVSTTAPKIVYCHNPARWLYQRDEYTQDASPTARLGLAVTGPFLRRWDKLRAATATRYVANSRIVAERIWQTYHRTAEVVPPPVSIDTSAPQEPIAGLAPGYFLTVSRGRGYKNVEAVVRGILKLPRERLVLVGSLPADLVVDSDRVIPLANVSDEQLRWLYANCRAVVSASHEDFGLTPLEGNAYGRPAAVLRAGGFLDTVVEGQTGVFLDRPTPESVAAAVLSLPEAPDEGAIRAHAMSFGESAFASSMRRIVDETLLATETGLRAVPAQATPTPAIATGVA
jgi:glycosyltransferase involved in cell wall biosynthesis